MASGLRVCVVVNSLGSGGAENLIIEQVRYSSDIEYTVVHFGSSELEPELKDAGGNAEKIEEGFRFDPNTIYDLVKFLDKNSFDVVHSHLAYAHTVTRIACWIVGIPLVSTHHTLKQNQHLVTQSTEKFTRNLTSVNVAVSEGVKQSFTNNAEGAAKSWRTIYNGIDVGQFSSRIADSDSDEVRRIFEVSRDAILFLNVGRYVPGKSQKDIIRAFSKMNLPNSYLLLVGYGPLETELKGLASTTGVADRVFVSGRVPHELIHSYYAAADVFVLPSQVEGLPITLLEAMAASLPIIGSDIAGINEVIVDGDSGFLFECGNTQYLAMLMEQLGQKETLRQALGNSANRRAHSQFDVSVMSTEYTKLYSQVAK